MKQILLISFYSFPLNGVSSYRISSFISTMQANNYSVTLLTRHWDKNFSSWKDITKSTINKEISDTYVNGVRVVKIPFFSYNNKFFIKKFGVFMNYLKGNLQPELSSFDLFFNTATKLHKEINFDLVLVSAPPNNLIKVAYKLHNKYKLPFIVDFRDFLNHKNIFIKSKTSISTMIYDYITEEYIAKWLSKSIHAISPSPRINNILNKKTKKEFSLLTNGFVDEYFNEIVYTKNNIFTIRYIGSAYSFQNFELIIDVINELAEQGLNIKVELIGIHNQDITDVFTTKLRSDLLTINPTRLPINDVIKITRNTDILLLPYNNVIGSFGTKIFDYLASGSKIMLYPSDNGLIEGLIKEYNNDEIPTNKNEIMHYIIREYASWVNNKQIKYNINRVLQFARTNATLKLVEILNNYFHNDNKI